MNENNDYLGLVREHSLFAALPEVDFEKLAESFQVRRLKSGEMLFNQDDRAEHFYYVVSGSMKLFRLSAKGNEKVVEIVRARQTFAEAVMFMEHQAYPVFAAALESTRLMEIESIAYRSALDANPDACFRLLADLSRRLRRKLGEIDALSLQNARLRVVHYLLEQASQNKNKSFELDAQKRILASRLSIQPETLSRTLAELKQNNVIDLKGAKITILDRARLHALALDT